MIILYLATGLALLLSLLANPGKTKKALQVAWKKFIRIFPSFLAMLILVSFILYLIPDQTISRYLGSSNREMGLLLATVFGSLALMPGFIAYPLCGILLKKGVAYMVLSAFATTLMMVGILTFPIERTYLGTKIAVVRNLISLLIALFVALITGIVFGEIF